ncbi:MAG: GNAT family N-acetyltransferase [Streptosporangiaceae bacterium]|jgi:RimJ/RimL family protein N-acetyltransferase
MPSLPPPLGQLTDGVVTLRVPSIADVDDIVGYAEQEDGLNGAWLPSLYAGASRERCFWMVADWLAGWAGEGSCNGPALVMTADQSPALVGHVGFVVRNTGAVELVHGVAPAWRGQGLATRAVWLAAEWLLHERGIAVVELRMGQDRIACQRVAVKAGFSLAGTVSSVVEATGKALEHLRYTIHAADSSVVRRGIADPAAGLSS